MPEAYSKLCQISKMMRDIENPGIVIRFIQALSGIFSDIQQYSVMFRDTEGN